MDQLKQTAFSVTIVIAAGFWGYGGDNFMNEVDTLVTDLTAEAPEEIPAEEETTKNATSPLAKSKQAASSPYPPAPPQGQRPVRPGASAPLGGNNPYASMGKPASLAGTMDSIRPGRIQNQQRQKRNLYFERLSQQLKDLQGNDNTPPPRQKIDNQGDDDAQEDDGGGPPPKITAAIATDDDRLIEVDEDGVLLDDIGVAEDISDEELDELLDEIIE